jgi:hypothetical protein
MLLRVRQPRHLAQFMEPVESLIPLVERGSLRGGFLKVWLGVLDALVVAVPVRPGSPSRPSSTSTRCCARFTGGQTGRLLRPHQDRRQAGTAQKGCPPLATTISTEHAAPVIAGMRLRGRPGIADQWTGPQRHAPGGAAAPPPSPRGHRRLALPRLQSMCIYVSIQILIYAENHT